MPRIPLALPQFPPFQPLPLSQCPHPGGHGTQHDMSHSAPHPGGHGTQHGMSHSAPIQVDMAHNKRQLQEVQNQLQEAAIWVRERAPELCTPAAEDF